MNQLENQSEILPDTFAEKPTPSKGLIVVMISTDRNIFVKGSAVRQRMIEYGSLFTDLHIIVYAESSLGLRIEQVAPNVYVYPTNSSSRWSYIPDAKKMGSDLISKLKRLYKDYENIVIDVQDPFETGRAGAYLAQNFSLKLHVQVHTDFFSPYFKKLSWLNKIRVMLAPAVLKKAYAIRVVSNRIKQSLIDNLRIHPSRILVLPIFTDILKIEKARIQTSLRARHNRFNFIILMACRLVEEKNLFFALDVFSKVIKKYPQAGLIITGDGPLKRQLENHARRLAIENSVVFEPWQDDMVTFYKSADMLLSTSWYEGYGLTFAEASLCGLPIVTSDVGVAGDILIDGQSAFICSVGDKECFESKILALISDKSIGQLFGSVAKKAFEQSLPANKQDYLRQYRASLERC
jgi:glycosyltransferase involved in cell wall biosynthesis